MARKSSGRYVTGWCGGQPNEQAHDKCPHITTSEVVCECECHEEDVK
jgi:hypothetical protein